MCISYILTTTHTNQLISYFKLCTYLDTYVVSLLLVASLASPLVITKLSYSYCDVTNTYRTMNHSFFLKITLNWNFKTNWSLIRLFLTAQICFAHTYIVHCNCILFLTGSSTTTPPIIKNIKELKSSMYLYKLHWTLYMCMYVRAYVCMYVHYMSIIHWSRSNKRVHNLCMYIHICVRVCLYYIVLLKQPWS